MIVLHRYVLVLLDFDLNYHLLIQTVLLSSLKNDQGSFDVVTSTRVLECDEVSSFEEVFFWQINYMLKLGGLCVPGNEADKNEVLQGLFERNGFITLRSPDGSVVFEKVADVPPFSLDIK